MKKIIVAHEGKQHSFMTAEALDRKDKLFKYITTIYYKKNNWTDRLSKFVRGDNRKKLLSHQTKSLKDSSVLQFCELKALLRLILSHFSFFRNFHSAYYDWLHDEFGKSVANYAIKNNVDAVIMYDTNCNKCWSILKKKAPQIKRIMDVSIANRLFMIENFEQDIIRTGDDNIKKEMAYYWSPKNKDRYLQEILDTDYFLVASNIVKKSLVFSGIDPSKILMAPYGVDVQKFNYVEKAPLKLPLKLIYVGQVTYRKGMHHLLKVISSFNENEVELYLAGGFNPNTPFYKQYKDHANIHFCGFVTRDVLANIYQQCDVFVFPTLGEGYGMVVLEALSCGVPCIVSDLAGGDDAIIDGYNGFKFTAGDDVDLKNKIQWFIDHPAALPEMSRNSRVSAEKQPWSSYFESVNKAVDSIFQ